MAQSKNLEAMPIRPKREELASGSPSSVIDRLSTGRADVAPSSHVCGLPTHPDAQAFCEHYGLEDTIRQAVHLVKTSFHSASDLKLYKESDPESGESYLVIDFRLRGDIDQILAEDEKFIRQWMAVEPKDKEGLVTILFDIA